MKTKFLIFLLPLLAAGCKEKETACAEYAPADAAISWTDYNSVGDFLNYFRCHKKTILEHEGDTLAIEGWLYWGNPDAGEPIFSYMHENISDVPDYIYLTNNEDHFGINQTVSVKMLESVGRQFLDYREEWLSSKWKLKGVLCGQELGTGHCCSYEAFLEMIQLEIKKQ